MNKIKLLKTYWNNQYKKFIKNFKKILDVKIYENYYLFENNMNINLRKIKYICLQSL